MQRKPCQACNGTGQELNHKAIGKDAKARRVAVGKTQLFIALKMGISFQYLADLESGRKKWTADLLKKFDVAVKQLQ